MNDVSPSNQLRRKRISFACLAVAWVLASLIFLIRPALGQGATPAATAPSSSPSYNSSPSGNSASGGAGQSNNPGAVLSQSPFAGSVPEGKAMAGILPLSFKDAIDRGLRNNLGILLQSDSTLTARERSGRN